MANRAEHQIAQPQLQVTDDLGLLLEVLPERIRQPIEEMPDPLAVWTLINSHVLARCIHVVADFGVPDALDSVHAK